MKKSIGIGIVVSGIALLAAMATAGADEAQPTEKGNSVVEVGDQLNSGIWDPKP